MESHSFESILFERLAESAERFEKSSLIQLLKYHNDYEAARFVEESGEDIGFDWLCSQSYPVLVRAVKVRRLTFEDLIARLTKTEIWDPYLELRREADALGKEHIGLIFNLPGHGRWIIHNVMALTSPRLDAAIIRGFSDGQHVLIEPLKSFCQRLHWR